LHQGACTIVSLCPACCCFIKENPRTTLRPLPIITHISIAPVTVVVLLFGLVAYTLHQVGVIREENENIRQWARITDRLYVAIAAGNRMSVLAHKLLSPEGADVDDLHFDYLEQSRIFSESILYPQCVNKMSEATREQMINTEAAVRYTDNFDPAKVVRVLDASLPQLENVYKAWRSRKRAAYTDYYDNLQVIINQLTYVSLSVLLLCIILTIAMTVHTRRTLKQRIGKLYNVAQALCEGNVNLPKESRPHVDELDDLAGCFTNMARKLVHTVSTSKVLEGAEAERRRIAMDMHDQLLADLTAIKRTLSDKGGEATREVVTELDQVMVNIRNLIDDLHPHSIELLGLRATLEGHVNKLKKSLEGSTAGGTAIYASLSSIREERLTPSQKINLYRIAVEGINNALKHAQASRIEVTLSEDADGLTLRVEDNGRGFDPDSLGEPAGYGLANMRERAALLGAEIRWHDSRFSSGTAVTLTLPLEGGPAKEPTP